jgi:hypothetical protein
MEPTLAEKVSVLQRELNLPAGATLNEKVEKALETLGLADELRELPLVRKVDAALQTLGATPQTSVQMGAPVPMGAPVSMVTPVAMATPLAQAQAHAVSIVQAVPGNMQMDREAHAIEGRAGPLRLTLVSHPGQALTKECDWCLPFPPPVFICCLSDLKLGGEHEALTVHYHPGTGLLNRPECCDQRIHNSANIEAGKNSSENQVLSFRCGVFPCPDHESWQFYSDGTIHNRHAPHLVLGIRDSDGGCILVPEHDTRRRMVFREVISASG